MTDGPTPPKPRTGAGQEEVRWTVRQMIVLARCWTLPMDKSQISSCSTDERASVRASTLFLIVFLIFVLRAESGTSSQVSLAAALSGAFLSFLLGQVSSFLGRDVPDGVIVSAYGTVLMSVLVFIIIDFFGPNFYWYYFLSMPTAEFPSRPEAIAALGAGIVVLFFWIAKARLFDGHPIGFPSIFHALAVTALAIMIVFLSATLNGDIFQAVQKSIT